MQKSVHYPSSYLPYLLIAPQIIITLVFFIWPAAQALYQSFLLEDAFGMSSEFVWFDNFAELFDDPDYLGSFNRTAFFSVAVAFVSMSLSLLLAAMADRVIKASTTYRTLLIIPYVVAPVLAGTLWLFIFNPTIGIFTYYLDMLGIDWNHKLNSSQAMGLVILTAAWKQISYNFLFFIAAMHSIPKSLIEAAAIDGAGPVHRFRTIIFPLISPTTFFLLVV
ncbi:MAG: ABC transporter permease subunit, partial [Pseudomonadales bacterium]